MQDYNDSGGFGILEPLVGKLLEYNLFCVNITSGKKDGENFSLIYFFGGQWLKIFDNGFYECSNAQLFALLQNLFNTVMIVPLLNSPDFLQSVQGGTTNERAPVNKIKPIK